MISMIACKARNGTIGKDGALPWHLPADLAYFKSITSGHVVIMGRKTYESIGKPLPKRQNVILTRDRSYHADGCDVIHSVDSILEFDGEVFIIGGAEVYRQCLPYADRLYITEIDEDIDGDAFLFEIDPARWSITSSVQGIQDEKNPYSYRFVVYERINH
jgi:dihydrofolate reductase